MKYKIPKKPKKRKTAKKAALRPKMNKKVQAEKKKKLLKIIKWTSLIVIILVLWIGFFSSSLFDIKKIEVTGNTKLTSDQIIDDSKIIEGKNIFKYMKPTIIKNIKGNPYIESVKIKRKYPNQIVITVQERSIKYYLKYNDNYVYINSQGYILELSSVKPEVPELKGYSTKPEELVAGGRINIDDLEKLSTVIKILDSCKEINISELISFINIKDKDDYSIYLEQEKKLIKLGDATNLSTKMLYIKSILENTNSMQGTIFAQGNLNKGFKIYFREENLEL